MVTLRQLRYFGVLGRDLHYGKAAATLEITQSALSQQIKVLEKHLGVRLVVSRGTKGAELTKAGEVLLDGAGRVLDLCEEVVQQTREAAGGTGGTLRVAYSLSGVSLGQRDIVEQFRRRFPEVRIGLDAGCSANNVGMLNSGQADVVFVREAPKSAEVESILLAEEELVVVLSRGHRLSGNLRVTRAEVRREAAAMWPRRLAPELYDRITEQVWGSSTARIVREEPDYENLCSAVAESGHLAVMDRRVAERHAGPGTVIRRFAAPVPTTEIAVAWRAAEREPVVRRFVALAQEHRQLLAGDHLVTRGTA